MEGLGSAAGGGAAAARGRAGGGDGVDQVTAGETGGEEGAHVGGDEGAVAAAPPLVVDGPARRGADPGTRSKTSRRDGRR